MCTRMLYTIIVILVLHNADALVRIDPLVIANVGTIRGLRDSGGEYSMFLGIPYAKVDEANPFGPSTIYPNFEDIFEAYDDSAICPQIEEFNNTIVGSLDCLHLNIYVPNSATSKNRLPVLVWIYGGGYEYGFASRFLYGPNYLVRHGVILVTLNYRVGPYGFMCLDTPEVPGNQGLKDQLLALRWIRDNIEAFGGDADQITIFGESAGSISVDFHLRYTNENLFSKVMLQSGTTLTPIFVKDSDRTLPIKIAERLGVTTDDFQEALSFLATVDTDLVIAATSKLTYEPRGCVEEDFDDVEKYIWDHPVNVKVTNNKIPILIGVNEKETLTFYNADNADSYKDTTVIYDSLKSYFDFDDDYLNEMYDITRHFYFGDGEVNDQFVWNYIDFTSDFMFVNPTTRSIGKFIEDGIESVFQYVFTYDGKRNFVKHRLNLTAEGAAHADEIGYLFDISYLGDNTPEDQLTVDRMTTMWTNFVKYGNPTPEITDLLPVTWKPVNAETYYYLDIGSSLNLKTRPFKERMAYWELFFNLNEKLQKGYREN